jgi:hypothetical protein
MSNLLLKVRSGAQYRIPVLPASCLRRGLCDAAHPTIVAVHFFTSTVATVPYTRHRAKKPIANRAGMPRKYNMGERTVDPLRQFSCAAVPLQ